MNEYKFKKGFTDYLNVTLGRGTSMFTASKGVQDKILKLIYSLKNNPDKNAKITYNLFENGYAYSCGVASASLWLVLGNISSTAYTKGNDFFAKLVELDSTIKKLGVSNQVAKNFVFGLLNATGSKANRDNLLNFLRGSNKEISKGRDRFTTGVDKTTNVVKSVAPQTWVPELINPLAKSLSWQSWALIGSGLFALYYLKVKK